MKTKLLISCLLLISYFSMSTGQVPQGINYQAVARDGIGTLLVNASLGIRVGILTDTILNSYVWEEEQNVVTNNFGIFSIVIGNTAATKIQGTAPSFSAINWRGSPLYVRLKVKDGGTVWHEMGSAKLWSVPYAMTSGDLAGAVKKLQVTGTETSLDSALFEVKNMDGQTVFAVYNEGVRIYVDDGLAGKGRKGGFAVGGFDKAKGIVQDYFIVNSDSIRAYINTDTVKARKGGFAVGGFSPAKKEREEFLRVTRDSTRIYLNDTGTKGRKGGFAVGGFSKAKGDIQDYLLISQDSIRMYIKEVAKYNNGGFAIGGITPAKGIIPQFLSVNYDKTTVQVNDSATGFSLANIQTGTSEDFMRMNAINYRIGHQSGEKLNQLIGKYNTFIGYRTGFSTTDGRENLFVGYLAGYNNLTASYNVYMGTESGRSNVNGTSNVFIGFGSGRASTTSSNTYIGMKAGYANNPGAGNTYIGYCSGVDDGRPGYTGGSFNTFLGFNSGAKNYSGSNNVYLGAEASGNSRGGGRVFIGYQAGYSTFGDNLLIIENSSSASPLVWGDFTNDIFKVNGSIQYTGTIGQVSDATLKINIKPLEPTLNALLSLNPCTFNWKPGAFPDLAMPGDRQIGLLAQDVEKIFPELVSSMSNSFKTVDYTKLGVLMLPAINELNQKISSKDSEITTLKDEVTELKSRLTDLEKKIDILISGNSFNK